MDLRAGDVAIVHVLRSHGVVGRPIDDVGEHQIAALFSSPHGSELGGSPRTVAPVDRHHERRAHRSLLKSG